MTYTYDGNGGRVKKSGGTLYWYSLSGDLLTETDTSGNLINDYIYFGGVRVARVSSTSIYFYYSDALGTSRTITDSTGHTCYDADTYPFGGNLTFTSSCSQNFQFAGTYHDSETGLEHTWFRQYTSNSGRWLSPDPLGGDSSNPQSLNRYAYVTNNPTTLTDPLGLQEGLTPPTPGDTCQNVMPGADRATACIGVYQSSNPNFFITSLPTWGWASHILDYLITGQGFYGGGKGDPPDWYPGHFNGILIYALLYRSPGGNGGLGAQAANNFTLGVRAPGQTWSQCMSANVNNYSMGGAAELAVNVATGTSTSYSSNAVVSTFTGNGVAGLMFGEGTDAAQVALTSSPDLIKAGMGTVTTYGRNSTQIMALNIARSGGAPQALSSASRGVGGSLESASSFFSLGLKAGTRWAIDVGLTGAEAIGCAIPRGY